MNRGHAHTSIYQQGNYLDHDNPNKILQVFDFPPPAQ